jgi:prepilin-type processing-associated H-X9-DG protein
LTNVTDGMSNTILIYECAGRGETQVFGGQIETVWAEGQFPWAYSDNIYTVSLPTRKTVELGVLRPINHNNTISMYSFHPGGVNTLFGDGHVQFLAETTDPEVVRALASREGGEAVSAP